jgi:hypothetical protein
MKHAKEIVKPIFPAHCKVAIVLKARQTGVRFSIGGGNDGEDCAAALHQFCGQCHRVTGNLADIDWGSPWSYRHQSPYLERSRCLQKSAEKLSCLSCHDSTRTDAARRCRLREGALRCLPVRRAQTARRTQQLS